MRIGIALLGLTAFSIVLAAGLLWSGLLRVPDRWNPWATLSLADPPNFLTGYKLKRLAGDRAQCLAVLESSALTFTPLEDRTLGVNCHYRNAVRVNASIVAYSSGFVATCPLAVGLALFERHALQPAAQAAFGQPVTGVTHYGTYACRNVNNRESGRRSQHATANAIDLAAFRFKDGKTVNLQRDWMSADEEDGDEPAAPPDAEARFLRDLQTRACRIFPTVLGPDYNAAHHNHFHMDMGGFSICR